jgi:glycosyltransferase involved in cell wall biosynthesis
MEDADIIHIFNYYSNFYDTLAPVLRFKNMKFVAQGQAIAPSTLTMDLRKLVALRFADYLMPLNSDDVKRITTKYKISNSKVTLIPNGVDTSFFKPMNKRKARNALGFEEGSLHVLTVARLEHAKGIDILLRAFAKAVQSGLKVRLVVLGDGPERANLESLANALGVRKLVSFTGFVPNELTPCYYNAADIFVLPSREETFGIVLLEAMACSLPVVGSKVGGIKDIIRHAVNGFLFNVEDYEALAFTLFKLLNDEELRRNLGVRARRMAEEEYDNEKIYLKLLKVYKEVLEHPR